MNFEKMEKKLAFKKEIKKIKSSFCFWQGIPY